MSLLIYAAVRTTIKSEDPKLHLITIAPVLVLGPFILFRQRGDRTHVLLGRIWAYLMIVSCLLTFGITHQGSYSWLHLLAVFTWYQVIRAIVAIKKGNIRVHQRAMVGSYLGAIVAFVFAATAQNRLINNWILSLLQ